MHLLHLCEMDKFPQVRQWSKRVPPPSGDPPPPSTTPEDRDDGFEQGSSEAPAVPVSDLDEHAPGGKDDGDELRDQETPDPEMKGRGVIQEASLRDGERRDAEL